MKPVVMWAIAGTFGQRKPYRSLYTHTYFTRREAIQDHTRKLGKSWSACRRKGDQAVRVRISIATVNAEGNTTAE